MNKIRNNTSKPIYKEKTIRTTIKLEKSNHDFLKQMTKRGLSMNLSINLCINYIKENEIKLSVT